MAKISSPAAGQLYHGVFPGGDGGNEAAVTRESLAAYERAAGRKVAWVYFSHEWVVRDQDGKPKDNSKFPIDLVNLIHGHGAAPFIRLMLRSSDKPFIPEPKSPIPSQFQSIP